MDIAEFLNQLIEQYQNHIVLLIVVFGLLHPLTENPWSLFTLGLGITVLGAPLAYVVILSSNTLGVILLYGIMHWLHKRSNYRLQHSPHIGRALVWIAKTPMYKHIIVIGLPSVPTYPIKIAMPLTNMGFRRYLITLMGSYIFLTIANSLLYYGVFGLLFGDIPDWISVTLLVLFAILIYAGKDLRKLFSKSNSPEVNE